MFEPPSEETTREKKETDSATWSAQQHPISPRCMAKLLPLVHASPHIHARPPPLLTLTTKCTRPIRFAPSSPDFSTDEARVVSSVIRKNRVTHVCLGDQRGGSSVRSFSPSLARSPALSVLLPHLSKILENLFESSSGGVEK